MSTANSVLTGQAATFDHAYLRDALKRMMEIRTVEQLALDFSLATPPKLLGSAHFCAGQEAVPVGTAAALNDNDQIVATYRGHGWALSSGLPLEQILGEICQKSIGINRGRGGSAYIMAPWTRFIGENSIVGAGLPIGCGVAQANKLQGNNQVVAVSLGDGAFNQGATHEGLAYAAARTLPLIIICENNGWAEMTPTSEIFKVNRIAQRASGYGITGVTIDGTDPIAVRDTVRQAAEHARKGGGPVLIECRVPRLWGHYNRDIEHYRPMADRQAAGEVDPIELAVRRLTADGLMTPEEVNALWTEVKSGISSVADKVMASAPPDPATAAEHVWAPVPEVPAAPKSKAAEPPPAPKTMTYIQAVNEALVRELQSRPEVLVYGEDVGFAGGIFGASRNLQKTQGKDRVFDTPISESAILGSAVGSALMGMRPIVEIMWADFLLVALDQLINQAANVRYVTSGRSVVPIVVRTQQGATPGSCAQHSQSLEALLTHIPGLRVALPGTPQDAYDILRAAVAHPDPCIIFESRGLYQMSGPVVLSDEIQPIGKAILRVEGKDAVIVTWGTMVRVALEAAEQLAKEGIKAGVLDLRWLSPLDEEALRSAVGKAGGRVVVAHEANLTGGFGAEIVARLHETMGEKSIKVRRVASPDVRIPAAPVLSAQLIPNAEKIVAAVKALL
ncbi:MAG TPA: thiamine pyrophosphate-dependent enzyme [Acidobacteriaceae bacterium]|nr:thiamine pyrophosphate-dependent enzyme [Acidobacteriaceae bacterium]